MKSLNADVFVDFTTAKFAAQAIRKGGEIGWKPLHLLNNISASIGSVIQPAGYENAQGVISTAYLMDALDPQWKDDPGRRRSTNSSPGISPKAIGRTLRLYLATMWSRHWCRC